MDAVRPKDVILILGTLRHTGLNDDVLSQNVPLCSALTTLGYVSVTLAGCRYGGVRG